ncbi:uncharacterized protein [Notothenia coriiceps]|uniref:Uncharacterized protein n=1 Tax=Notothenia coriiceps TaxID=8208 RepID=A0A6I9PNX5_9TELE|nr:PREDICTED: uncharacterized protein LOC104965451 [Notothenia coriiceps]
MDPEIIECSAIITRRSHTRVAQPGMIKSPGVVLFSKCSQLGEKDRLPHHPMQAISFAQEEIAVRNNSPSKAADPNAIQCPLCRGLTPLPTLGLARLATNSDMLSYLPAAMQRVYSIRFVRNKGKLQVKRSTEGHLRWTSLRTMNRSLDVGLPSPPVTGRSEVPGLGGALFRLTGRPVCRAFLLTAVVMMMVLLTSIIIFLLHKNKDSGE